jgi:hypothetical protein
MHRCFLVLRGRLRGRLSTGCGVVGTVCTEKEPTDANNAMPVNPALWAFGFGFQSPGLVIEYYFSPASGEKYVLGLMFCQSGKT